MPSRWMAPKLQKMRQPYSDQELMILGSATKCPPPAVLDAIAERWMYAGWDPGKVCLGCGECLTLLGDCPRAEPCTRWTPSGAAPQAGVITVTVGPSGVFRDDGTTYATREAPEPGQPRARYQSGARGRREQGLSGPRDRDAARKAARQARTRARKASR